MAITTRKPARKFKVVVFCHGPCLGQTAVMTVGPGTSTDTIYDTAAQKFGFGTERLSIVDGYNHYLPRRKNLAQCGITGSEHFVASVRKAVTPTTAVPTAIVSSSTSSTTTTRTTTNLLSTATSTIILTSPATSSLSDTTFSDVWSSQQTTQPETAEPDDLVIAVAAEPTDGGTGFWGDTTVADAVLAFVFAIPCAIIVFFIWESLVFLWRTRGSDPVSTSSVEDGVDEFVLNVAGENALECHSMLSFRSAVDEMGAASRAENESVAAGLAIPLQPRFSEAYVCSRVTETEC